MDQTRHVAVAADPAGAGMAACAHCGLPVPENSAGGGRFCCQGCKAAHAVINALDLGRYYDRREIDPQQRPLRPDADVPAVDYEGYVRNGRDGISTLDLMVDGLHCAACVWLIESVLSQAEGVVWARVNMTTRRLVVRWRTGEAEANDLVGRIAMLGYRLMPFDPEAIVSDTARHEKRLLKAMAVAGFAAGNIMLLSISVWSGNGQDMGPATRGLMLWISAVIAIPAVAYAGRPFFVSAATALRRRRVNMDVPISVAVLLATGMSFFQTATGAEHAYFDSAVALLFFLLVGRYLDSRARGRARSAAEHLLALGAAAVTVLESDGTRRLVAPRRVQPGMTVLVAAGERIGVDARVAQGDSEVDASLISGESAPSPVRPGDAVYAGMINLAAPIRIAVTAAGEDTLLAEIVRLMEAAEQGRAGYVGLADRMARLYSPTVHLLALGTFLGWLLLGTVAWTEALLAAIAVLIVTCPCALAIAVPAVQVIGSGRLMGRGVLLKSATALERLARADTVVFDKTGTLTEGRPALTNADGIERETLALAASMAATSTHPLARALCRAAPLVAVADGAVETPGAGLALETRDGAVRLGNRRWCGVPEDGGVDGPELWLTRPERTPVRFAFADSLRDDAVATVRTLREAGYAVALLSGDRERTVAEVANRVGIDDWRAGCSPVDKVAHLQALAAGGRRVAMIGDGLNDAPALAAASVSLSPATAADISQTAADVVFQGRRLAPVVETLLVARRSQRLVVQNFGLAFAYNAAAVPLAVAGFITPLVAAVAMSTSSLVVLCNALRLARVRRPA